MLGVVGYLFIQFCWRAWDYIQFTRLRITGTRVRHVTTAELASEYGDYPNDPIQSTLYNWWLNQARKIGNFSAMVDQIHRITDLLEKVANRPGNMEMPNINHVMQSASEINNNIAKLVNRIEEAEKTIGSARIPVSLERFDHWFHRYSKSQMHRIMFLDMIFPFVFGAMWIYLLVADMI